jgi:hypothetical protein
MKREGIHESHAPAETAGQTMLICIRCGRVLGHRTDANASWTFTEVAEEACDHRH